MELSLAHLNKIWGTPLNSESFDLSRPIGAVCIDSREILEGSFFVPIIGEKYNGHQFLDNALHRGAYAAVIASEWKEAIPQKLLHWRVQDTLVAYQEMALLHRFDLRLPVIAVTGSTGKTTTRELIRSVLSRLGDITCTEKNNNNDIGVPLSLLQAKRTDAAVVIEMGMRGLGEIKRLSDCTCPDIAVITNIGSSHLGRLGSRRNIAIAKCEITSSLKSNGVVVIPKGDYLLEEELSRVWKGKIVRVSIKDSTGLDHLVSEKHFSFDTSFELNGVVDSSRKLLLVEDQSIPLPLEGYHNAKNFMLAIAVGRELGVSFSDMKSLSIDLPTGRNRVLRIGQLTVLDESYNSCPESVRASLSLLKDKPGRHFVVIGTMKELGKESIPLHREVANYISQLEIEGIVIVSEGEEAKVMLEVTKHLKFSVIVSTPEAALPYLKSWLSAGDALLLKGSRAVGLERLLPLLQGVEDVFS